jgi:hypothetical protein
MRGVDRELVAEAKCGCGRCTTFGRVRKRMVQLLILYVGGGVWVEVVLGCLAVGARLQEQKRQGPGPVCATVGHSQTREIEHGSTN